MGLACAACGAEHEPGARFCSACGAPLFSTCPGCGSEQSAAASFCSVCGIALGEDARRGSGAEDRQERRVVSVLFADLAGSTALGESLDPEDVRELQRELFELVNSEVERFGGTTEKFVGDAVLAVFGIPQAHEDDPVRAVLAGLAVRDAFGSFAGRVRARHGAEVGLRIGVNTGEVVSSRESAARGELMVSGDAVNVAARLQQHAAPGEVLVGQRTKAATTRRVAYTERDDVDAKGKRTPVQAWVAVAIAETPGPQVTGGLTAPLVGRDEELAVLTAVATRVDRERAPQLVTLFGQAGVGKSRLLAELAERLPDALVLRGRCLPYGEGITYFPLAEAAKAHAGILETDAADVAFTKLRAAVDSTMPTGPAGLVLEAVGWTLGLSQPEAEPPEVARRLRDGWARYLAELGRSRLTLVAVEDVHWASGALIELVDHLAENVADSRVLFLCTARPELLDTHPAWGAGKQNATALTLTALSTAEAARMVAALLGETTLPTAARRRVLDSAEGNPFFVEEMLHMLIEEGALEQRNGSWAATERLDDVSIPDSIHGVIAARLDLLDAEPREALRRCSVVGRVFWPAAVGVNEDVIASLGRSGLVFDRASSVIAGMREFAFKHALTRDVAYASLPRSERRELHLRVAEWIPTVAPDRAGETAEVAAYHYGQAIAYGEDDAAVAHRAYELHLEAANAALSRAAFATAGPQLERALELAADDGQRARVQLALAQLDVLEGRYDGVLEQLGALEELMAQADLGFRSDVLAFRARVCWLNGHWQEALACAEGAVEALSGLPESRQLARALARRSQVEMLDDRPEAAEHALEAVAVARRVGDPMAEVNAGINALNAQAFAGIAPSAEAALGLVDAAVEAGVYDEAYRAVANFIWSAAGFLPVDRIVRVVDDAQERLGDVPPPEVYGVYIPLSLAAMLLVPAGRWDEAEAMVGEVDPGLPNARMVWLEVVGGLALRRGDLDTAAELLEELQALAFRSGSPMRIVPMASVALPHLSLAGRTDELRTAAVDVLAAIGDRWPAVLSATSMLRTLAQAGETELLTQTAESLRSARATRAARLATSVAAAEGLIALARGDAHEAEGRLRAGADRERELGFVYDAACFDLDVADALEAAGDADAAADARARAGAVLEPLGCVHPF